VRRPLALFWGAKRAHAKEVAWAPLPLVFFRSLAAPARFARTKEKKEAVGAPLPLALFWQARRAHTKEVAWAPLPLVFFALARCSRPLRSHRREEGGRWCAAAASSFLRSLRSLAREGEVGRTVVALPIAVLLPSLRAEDMWTKWSGESSLSKAGKLANLAPTLATNSFS